jgi:hypothetical protein
MTTAFPVTRASAGANLLGAALMMFVASMLTIPPVHASGFGITSSGQAGVNSIFPPQTWSTGGLPLAVTIYNSPVLAISNLYTIGGSTFTEGAHASLTMANGTLHAQADAFGSATGDSSVQKENAGGSGSFSGIWMDTIFIIGLPMGTPVDLLVTNTLDSFTELSVTPDTSNFAYVTSILSMNDLTVGFGGKSSELDNSNDAADGMLSTSFIYHTLVGDSLQLQHQLLGAAEVGTLFQARSSSATVDALNTSDAFISVLTPGASYTTASGVSYAAPSSVPEPAGLWLAGTALVAIGLKRGRTPE